MYWFLVQIRGDFFKHFLLPEHVIFPPFFTVTTTPKLVEHYHYVQTSFKHYLNYVFLWETTRLLTDFERYHLLLVECGLIERYHPAKKKKNETWKKKKERSCIGSPNWKDVWSDKLLFLPGPAVRFKRKWFF